MQRLKVKERCKGKRRKILFLQKQLFRVHRLDLAKRLFLKKYLEMSYESFVSKKHFKISKNQQEHWYNNTPSVDLPKLLIKKSNIKIELTISLETNA